MPAGFVVRKNQYYDSVFLMGVNKRLSRMSGIKQTAALMGTEQNKSLLADIGIQGGPIQAAQPSDLIVAAIGDTQQAVDAVLEKLDEVLLATEGEPRTSTLRTLEDGLRLAPAANLAVLTIPGEYVYREARTALEAGLNVFIFSSNMPIAQELELKQMASGKNLLVMGPDCGTSILHGVGIGFANAVRRGGIGAIGPSGTGLQEFTTLVHHAGHGVSHAIGTGSRDLSDPIGGLTTFAALEALERDPQTEVIALITKPPGPETYGRLHQRLSAVGKPVVTCFLGAPAVAPAAPDGPPAARTIDDAVRLAIRRLGGRQDQGETPPPDDRRRLATAIREHWSPSQKYVRGVFAGGTFCYQAQQIFLDRDLAIHSNVPLDRGRKLTDPNASVGHTLVDMGDEAYTLGRPHPMIDATLRNQRILAEGQDPEIAVLLLDFILGYNASEDPAGDLLDAIGQARESVQRHGGNLAVVASICGTDSDPQDLALQRKLLEDSGAIVFPSGAGAAQFCAQLVSPD